MPIAFGVRADFGLAREFDRGETSGASISIMALMSSRHETRAKSLRCPVRP